MPSRLRITLEDGSRFELIQPTLVRDSILGDIRTGTLRERKAIATRDIVKLEDRRFSPGKTVGLVAGLVGVAATAVVIAAVSAISTWYR